MAQPTVRTIRDDERATASKVVNYGMLGSVADEVSEAWAQFIDLACSHGAFSSDGQLVGFSRYFPTELSVPGGEIRAAGVTAVAVLSHHRRQGHLSRMMNAQLEAIAAEEIPIALLVAAEWPIYGRFGYGPSVDACGFEIDARTARVRGPATGSIEVVDAAELRPEIERCHEARRRRTPGSIRRDSPVWDRIAGLALWPGQTEDLGQRRGALWRDGSGEVQGAVSYKVDEGWTRNRPSGTADVRLLVGATPEAERELWRHLCEIDWVGTVKAGTRGVDDPLPYFLEDGRTAAVVDRFDCIWARILDVPGTLGRRRATTAGGSVVEVVDPLGHAAGRWQLDLGPDGADVAPTTATADVTLPVGALGAAYLGGVPVARLHEAGWLDEGAPGGAQRLGTLLATPAGPWSPTTY